MNELFSRLKAISKEGVSVVVKIDGERWDNFPSLPYTVSVFGGKLSTPFKTDSDNLEDAIKAALLYYKENITR